MLAAVLLFNVIEPNAKISAIEAGVEQKEALLANDEEELIGLQETQESLLVNVTKLDQELQRSEALLEKLGEIGNIIKAVPWDQHNQELQAMFRTQASFDYQAEANKTVRKIAAQIKTDVVVPFRSALADIEADSELATYPGRIEAAIGEWEISLIDQPWWLRRETKESTVREVTDLVSGLQTEALVKVDEGVVVVEERQREIRASQAVLAEKIAVAAESTKLKKAEINVSGGVTYEIVHTPREQS